MCCVVLNSGPLFKKRKSLSVFNLFNLFNLLMNQCSMSQFVNDQCEGEGEGEGGRGVKKNECVVLCCVAPCSIFHVPCSIFRRRRRGGLFDCSTGAEVEGGFESLRL